MMDPLATGALPLRPRARGDARTPVIEHARQRSLETMATSPAGRSLQAGGVCGRALDLRGPEQRLIHRYVEFDVRELAKDVNEFGHRTRVARCNVEHGARPDVFARAQ